MIALQGYYENGRLELSEKAPMRRAKVLVVFQEEIARKEVAPADWETFNRFSGSISRTIDDKAELAAARDERYADIDRYKCGD